MCIQNHLGGFASNAGERYGAIDVDCQPVLGLLSTLDGEILSLSSALGETGTGIGPSSHEYQVPGDCRVLNGSSEGQWSMSTP